jgi:hypothetical protein
MGQYDRMKKERRSEEGKKREGERGKLTLLLEFSRDKLVSEDPDVLGRGLSLEADLVLVRLKERKGKERKGKEGREMVSSAVSTFKSSERRAERIAREKLDEPASASFARRSERVR